MEWIFVTAVFLVTVFLSVRYRAFRRGLLFTVIGALALGAVGGAIAYFYDLHEQQQRQEKDRRLMALIRTNELKLDDLVLSRSSPASELWELKGNVTNLSNYPLDMFGLKIIVHNCPDVDRCVVVGESEEMISTTVPSNQMRSFSDYVTLRNVPELKNWKWFFYTTQVKAQAG